MRSTTKLFRILERCIETGPLSYKGKILAKHLLRSIRKSDLNWDPWILKDGEFYRLFYLAASNRSLLRPWWRVESKIHAAISKDMEHWEDLGMILKPEPSISWEAGRLFAGSTYNEDGVYYLFYSASGKDKDFMNEGIGLATSKDGLCWKREATVPLLKPDAHNAWYGDVKHHFQWRDPWIVQDQETGKYYMFLSAQAKRNARGKLYNGCIGLAVSDKINGPYEVLPPAAEPLIEGSNQSPFYEMERPQIIYRNGKYHLLFSAFTSSLNPSWLKKLGSSDEITDSTLFHYVSDKISGPFYPVREKPIVKGSDKTGIYGTNLFPDPRNPERFIAYGWRHRLFSLEITPLYTVNWQGDTIEITVT